MSLLDDLTRDLPHLLPLPEAVLRAIELMNERNARTGKIAAAIEADQALAARVLQMANSAYYALPRRIVSVEEALVRIGHTSTKELLYSAAAWHGIERIRNRRGLSTQDLWRHSLGTALCSRILAKRGGGLRADEAYMVGLLHDLGQLAIAQHAPEQMKAILELAGAGVTLWEAEARLLGFDHAEVGARLLTAWRLPEPVVEAVRWHHNPLPVLARVPLCGVVHVADVLCQMLGLAPWPRVGWQPAERAVVQSMGLEPADVDPILAEVEEALSGTEQYLGMDAGNAARR
ncbi:MAG: HDOD domain-containing protein [Dehalococcoidales bacterium]|nr:HDOD domain-containing protein [Dehalococcoidales bacterium]